MHVEEHGLSPEEVEEALLDPRRLGAPAYNVVGEERRAVIGATSAGRLLFVVVTRRGDIVRVVTARDANEWEKKRYRRRGK
jgi:uncharacterized DUF497 family protein